MLIPKLHRKTFVLKDFTEVLNMPRMQKDEVYSILRGAFDGEVTKPFGNGVMRHYKSKFSMITGVTHLIFAEQGASLGERFLIYHVFKGVDYNADDIIMAAINNVGHESGMKEDLSAIAHQFLNVRILPEDVPELDRETQVRLIALSQVVSRLRGTVDKDYSRDVLSCRGQYEIGTRPAKQLKKLMLGLALLKDEPVFDEEIWRVVRQVAMDTCNGPSRS